MIILAALIGFLILLGYYVVVTPYNYWKIREMQCEKPNFLIGNWRPMLFSKCCQSVFFKYFYDKYPNKRCIPLYQFLTPVLIVKDLELIKQITVKDFDSMPEHTLYTSEQDDPLWAKSLFSLPGGQEWKDVRSTLSPAFTKNKLKIMFNLLVACAQNLTKNLYDNPLMTFEPKDTFKKVVNDIIATTAFGIECDSIKNQDNEIFRMGKELLYFHSFIDSIKYLLLYINPFFSKLLKIRLVREIPGNFFMKIVTETMTFREQNRIIRPDMLHLMMEARKGKLKDNQEVTSKEDVADSKSLKSLLTDEVVTAQAIVFYMAGFETLSSALSFTIYELAINPDIQNKLFREISQTSKNCKGGITYEELLDVKYLDMVVSESLRKWPTAGYLDRRLIRPVNLSLEKDKVLSIDQNVICYIPVYAIHRDPEYWPEPDKFDPERFSDSNKYNINPFTYLAFGTGPRKCIAYRLATLTMKILLFHLISKFEITAVDKTPIPLKLNISFPDSISSEDFCLGIKPRKAV